MSKTIKLLLGLLFVFITILIASGVIVYFILKSYDPVYEGEIKLNGIKSEVKIYRDSNAVAYIKTENFLDAIFALGFVHAQERMFQMDVARRAGEGKLSEIFGNKTVPFDKMFKTIGLYPSVCEDYSRLNDITKKILDSYSKGVNNYIKSTDGKYSIEFDILGYQPYLWKPEHCLLVAKLMAWELNLSWWTDIAFAHLVQKFGAERVAAIIPGFNENAPTIIPHYDKGVAQISLDLINTDIKFRKFFGIEGTHIGSNNWIVNGKKSASGLPIIANDPHLAFSLQGKWFVASIQSDSLNVDGFTIPGLPGVVIGKNQNIAWAMTNVMTDDADFYIEKLDSSGTQYFLNSSWHELNTRKDTIAVKDSSAVVLEIKTTHRGPIISGTHSYNEMFPDSIQQTASLSMRWTALDFSDEFYAIYLLNTAANWNQFINALKYFTVPGQNFVYGDRKGNIGYVCAAKIPLRNTNSPTMVYDGTNDLHDWKGFVPYEQMPKLFNPSENFIASANNKTIKSFPYHISNIWEPSSRIERIVDLLNSKEKHSIDDCKIYQMDIISKHAQKIVPYILSAFTDARISDKNLSLALNLITKWDFSMTKESQIPSIYLTFFQKFLENIFLDEMGESSFNEYVFVANVPYRITEQLLGQNNSDWFDNINTPGIETRDDIIRKSFIDALEFLENKLGDDITYWQWSNLHTITFEHPFSGVSKALDKIVNAGPFEIGGDGTTLFNSEYSFTEPFGTKLGPSMRFIYDFANPDEFYYVLPTGQSGHILNDNYKNMIELWLEGKYYKLSTKHNSNTNKLKLLLLIPKD